MILRLIVDEFRRGFQYVAVAGRAGAAFAMRRGMGGGALTVVASRCHVAVVVAICGRFAVTIARCSCCCIRFCCCCQRVFVVVAVVVTA